MKTKLALLLFVVSLFVIACEGDKGDQGVMGITGPDNSLLQGHDSLGHVDLLVINETAYYFLCDDGVHIETGSTLVQARAVCAEVDVDGLAISGL